LATLRVALLEESRLYAGRALSVHAQPDLNRQSSSDVQTAIGFFLNDWITLLFVVPLAVVLHFGAIANLVNQWQPLLILPSYFYLSKFTLLNSYFVTTPHFPNSSFLILPSLRRPTFLILPS
jgi:hypothetical protein